MNEVLKLKLDPKIVCLLVFCPYSVFGGGGESTQEAPASSMSADSPSGPASLDGFSKYANAYRWETRSNSNVPTINCGQLLENLKNKAVLLDATRHAESDSPDDPRFEKMAGCATYNEQERPNAAVPNEFINGVRDFGDQSFVWYKVPFGKHAERHWDVMYGEFSAMNLQTNAYSDGYRVVNLSSCTKLGGLPVQRQLDRDIAGTPREVMHGLFSHHSAPLLLTATEQVGSKGDTGAFRLLNAWKINEAGKFKKICAWRTEV